MRIYRLAAKMAEVEGRSDPPPATSAADAALGLRPRRALSSAQLPLEWTTTTLLRNGSSLNGNYPLFPCLTKGVQFNRRDRAELEKRKPYH
jgi:hypothetical protein